MTDVLENEPGNDGDMARKAYDLGYFDHLLSERDHRKIDVPPARFGVLLLIGMLVALGAIAWAAYSGIDYVLTMPTHSVQEIR